MSEIRKWLPDAGLAGVRLHAGALREVQVEQSGGRTDKYGQFVLAVDDARDDPDDLFGLAHAAEQIGDIAEAERLYRLLMKSDPTDASAPFNLGNMLRASARSVEAEAALRRLHTPIQHLPKLGIISPICWMTRVDPKPPSNACAKRCSLRPATSMQCSI